MAGRRKQELPPNDASLTPDYWSKFTAHPKPTIRQKLLFLTIEDVGAQGAREFNGIRVCQRLNVSASLVNHYFGGRDGLIAEATAIAYINYVMGLHAAAAQYDDPSDALRAWMRAQVQWAKEHPGLAEILNYSSAHRDISALVERDFQREIQKHFEFNLAMIGTMVRAIRSGQPLILPSDPDEVDREEFIADTTISRIVPSVAWSTLGVAVWVSGQHTPSSATSEARAHFNDLLEAHIENVLTSIKVTSD